MQKHNPETSSPCIFSLGLQRAVLDKEHGGCIWGLPVYIPSLQKFAASLVSPDSHSPPLGALLRYLTFMNQQGIFGFPLLTILRSLDILEHVWHAVAISHDENSMNELKGHTQKNSKPP